jgi:hypothetical protein
MSEQHRQFRVLHYLAQRKRRERLTLGQRLDKALGMAKMMASARVSQLERQSPSAEKGGTGAPSGDLSNLYSPGVESPHDAFTYRSTVLIELLEREVDGHRAAAVFGDAASETREERDKRLLDFVERNLPVEVIDLLDPAQGGVKSIKRSLRRLA